MKYSILTIIITVLLTTFCSCQDLLDVKQHGARNTEEFYETDEEAQEALAAIYVYFKNASAWLIYDYYITNGLSDDFYTGGGARANDTGLEEVNEFRHDPGTTRVQQLFETYYTSIYRCNLVTSRVNPEESRIKARCVAEAKVIRAFVYLRLVSFFGECPLIAEEITDGEYARPSAGLDEIYAQIETDLTEAINSSALLEKETPDSQIVNVTKQTALSLLGKAYVYESTYLGVDRWQDARNAFNSVIESGKYELFQGNYSDQFHLDAPYTSESLFEINFNPDIETLPSTNGYGRKGWRTERFDQGQLEAARESGAVLCSDIAYGFGNPTESLYNAFVEAEGEDGYRLNEVMTTYKKLTEIPLCISNGNNLYGCNGYLQLKHMSRHTENLTSSYWAINIVFLRYAEVLLLAAEAELPLHGGNQAKVDEYMNQIRSRARIANQPGNYTLEDIQKEKRLELCMESTRFPDAVRWGIAKDVFRDKGKRVPSLFGLYDNSDNANEKFDNFEGYNVSWLETISNGYVESKHRFLPIPLAELNVNPYITQHEGW